MIKYLLDTNVWIEILRGNPSIKQKLSEVGPKECAVSEITVLELKMGEALAKQKSRPGHFIDQHLNLFLSDFKIIPIFNTFDFVAQEKARLQLEGTPAHNNFNLLIGCTAVVNDLIMVTDNIKDFKRIKDIRIENWMKRT